MTDELLIKFLLGETSSEENLLVNKWIAADPLNKKKFADFEMIWSTSKNLMPQSKVDENEAWNRFQTKVKTHKPVVKSLAQRYNWLKIAAAIFIVAGAWLAYTIFNQPDYIELAANSEVRTETLPDGSEITMNKNSVLTYSSEGKQRNVRLEKGEVFFNVSPDKAKPFIIRVDKVTVSVVGTSFNVKHSANKTEVIVETGIVRVGLGNNKVELHKNQKVVVDASGILKVQPTDDNLHNYYRSNQFVANNTPLWRVVEVLNEAYKTDIQISNPELRNLTLNTTFKNESLDNILQIISDTFDIKVIHEGNKIILK